MRDKVGPTATMLGDFDPKAVLGIAVGGDQASQRSREATQRLLEPFTEVVGGASNHRMWKRESEEDSAEEGVGDGVGRSRG